jgi:Phosphorylase superfamily.
MLERRLALISVFAQYTHINEILEMGCNVIEMETAAAFTAAYIAHIPIAAIFSVSDNTILNKSLVSGRTKEEMDYRKYIRHELFPKIILETLYN